MGRFRIIIKKVFFYSVAIILGVTAGLVTAEIAVRMLKFEDCVRVVQKTRGGEKIFGADRVGDGFRFKISSNPRLLYEPSNPPPLPRNKSEGELRILCLGDSVTDNEWQPMRTTWPAVLEKALARNPNSPWKKVEVINSAATGYNAVQSYEWYKQQWQDHEFDLVVFGYCCANDRTEVRHIEKIDGELYCAMSREYIPCVLRFPGQGYLLRFSALYRFLNIKYAPWFEERGRSIREYRRDLTSGTRAAVLGLKSLSEKNGARFILLIFPELKPEKKEHEWILKLAKEAGIDFVDLEPVFKSMGYGKVRIVSKGGSDILHPSQRGHNSAARLLARKILPGEEQPGLSSVVFREHLSGNLLSGEGMEITADSRNLPREGVDKIYDNDPGTYWHASLSRGDRPNWVLVDFGRGKGKKVCALAARPRRGFFDQFFRNAELEGSNDGLHWSQIAPIIQEKAPRSDEWRLWEFENNRSFRYYRLVISDGHEDGPRHRFYSLSELALYE